MKVDTNLDKGCNVRGLDIGLSFDNNLQISSRALTNLNRVGIRLPMTAQVLNVKKQVTGV